MNNPPRKLNFKVLGRAVKLLFQFYPAMTPIAIACIIFSAVVVTLPAIFIQKVTAAIDFAITEGQTWEVAKETIIPNVLLLLSFYVLSIVASVFETQVAAIMTQGYLGKMRKKMFDGMQNLPIRYFDTHKHGDIMSYYTNDIDTLRMLISQSLPTILRAGTVVIAVFLIMLYYSIWLTLIVVGGVILMILVSAKLSGGSSKYFVKLQKAVGSLEGFVQEIMNGQKVVKVFNHEKQSTKDYEVVNNELYQNSYKANAFANMLGPIIMNIGNCLYVIVCIVGCILLVTGAQNLGIYTPESGIKVIDVSIIVAFLSMTKQFTGNVNQVSQQVNSIVMAAAGAQRVFDLMDEPAEVDNGYVTLVNCKTGENGEIIETKEKTGHWAWKHPHSADGTITYTPLKGDVRLVNVDFEYRPNHQILYDINVYAEPGQKVAFVGATGAGKTTITNLINRYYDIADGKIRYDGININKIRKSDLRRSLGIVLQDTNLFTGTVMENIRYGNLEASDEDCIKAAKLAGADDFITRLPSGYNTELTNNGANLSQGQRQLIAIARAAVADPPVMILDEATSSIDTRTEAIVQRGMDKLMEGRTVFVIAHRLSTVMNSDVIMVMDHGHIIERGNHEKLIEEKGTYYQLYTGAFELE